MKMRGSHNLSYMGELKSGNERLISLHLIIYAYMLSRKLKK